MNSRNFLSSLSSNFNTCSEHRVFTQNITTALRRYQTCLENKKSSPDYDFTESPKLNVHCEKTFDEVQKVAFIDSKLPGGPEKVPSKK